MVLHENKSDLKDAGSLERSTGRYIPVSGGTRSKLPLVDEKSVRRYYGFVGIDESMTPTINSVATLFAQIGGGVYIPEGPAGEYIQKILQRSQKLTGLPPQE